MENEIELKIMLLPNNIPYLEDWLNKQSIISFENQTLGNTYYDTADLYFAQGKMGLRVRRKNQSFEMTLKMKGEIVGGLHIRPEYNLALPDDNPDFKRLVLVHNLQITKADAIQQSLVPIFSTDFTRKTWLLEFNQSQIEVALDQGLIKNQKGQEPICELEFELKSGSIRDLFLFLATMPKADGMWLSSLSKAQRGYLVGNPDEIAKECEKLTACNPELLSDSDKYQYEQQLADFIRIDVKDIYPELFRKYAQLMRAESVSQLKNYLSSADYLSRNLNLLEMYYLNNI